MLTVKGTLSAWQGSPRSDKSFWTVSGYPPDENIPATSRLAAIERKQEAIRTIFKDGYDFEVQPLDGSASIKCNPIVQSIDFEPGNWYNVCNYNIVLRASILYINGTPSDEDDNLNAYMVSKASLEYDVSPADEINRTWHVTKRTSAVGKRFYNAAGQLTQQAWENARDYVQNALTLGLDVNRMYAAGDLNYNTFQAFNYQRGENVNELAGTYSVTETWLAYDPNNVPDSYGAGIPALEDFNVSTRTTIQDGGLTTVSITGTIRGCEQRDNSHWQPVIKTRYQNALAKWTAVYPNLLARAEAVSTVTLNPIPLLNQAAADEVNGVISYTLEYNNRAVPDIANALSEIVTVTNEGAADVFAVLPVLGRATGPILQSIGTVTPKAVVVNIEAIMPAATIAGFVPEPNTDAIVLSFAPPGAFLASDVSNYSGRTGRYSRQTRYVYE